MQEIEADHDQSRKWQVAFDERQLKEIRFCRLYAKDFAHGATGHNTMLILAKLADLLDDYEVSLLSS